MLPITKKTRTKNPPKRQAIANWLDTNLPLGSEARQMAEMDRFRVTSDWHVSSVDPTEHLTVEYLPMYAPGRERGWRVAHFYRNGRMEDWQDQWVSRPLPTSEERDRWAKTESARIRQVGREDRYPQRASRLSHPPSARNSMAVYPPRVVESESTGCRCIIM